MLQNPQVVLAGTVSVSHDRYKMFYFNAFQEILNFLDWEYVANQTKINVRAAINVRSFEGDPGLDIPRVGSHVIVRGQFDDYLLDSRTKYITILKIIVDSFEVLCTRPCTCNVPMPSESAPSSSSSLEDDNLRGVLRPGGPANHSTTLMGPLATIDLSPSPVESSTSPTKPSKRTRTDSE